MSEGVLFLEIPSKKVRIGGEDFTIREFGARKLTEYIKLRFKASEIPRLDSEESAEAFLENLHKDTNDLIRMILGDMISDEWIEKHFVFSTKMALIQEQDKLNSMEDILKKTQIILSQEAQAIQDAL